MAIRFLPNAASTPFAPTGDLSSTTVQTAIVEALADAYTYADQVASGLDPKAAVKVATDAVLPGTVSYATLNEINSDAALGVIDGTYTPVNGDRILVKNQVASQYNGIYVVTSAAAPFKLTRSSDCDNTPGIEVTSGLYTFALYGVHAAVAWVLLASNPITINVTPLPFDILCMADAAGVVNTPSGNIVATTVQAAIDELDTEKAALTGATFTGPARGSATVLTSASNSIAINLGATNDFTHTTTENTTLAAPTNVVIGQRGRMIFTQGATPMTMGFNVFWKFANGIIPSLTNAAGAIDVMTYDVLSSGTALCAMFGDVR